MSPATVPSLRLNRDGSWLMRVTFPMVPDGKIGRLYNLDWRRRVGRRDLLTPGPLCRSRPDAGRDRTAVTSPRIDKKRCRSSLHTINLERPAPSSETGNRAEETKHDLDKSAMDLSVVLRKVGQIRTYDSWVMSLVKQYCSTLTYSYSIQPSLINAAWPELICQWVNPRK